MMQELEFKVSRIVDIVYTDTGPKKIFAWLVTCKECSQMIGAADTPESAQILAASHAQAVHAAHQHMTNAHAPARPVTQLRQTRPNNWRNR